MRVFPRKRLSMRRLARAVVLPLLLTMTLSASDWPYLDEILEDLGSPSQQASVGAAEEDPAPDRHGTTTPGQHALYYQLLLVHQGVLSTRLEILPVHSASAAPPEPAASFRSEVPEGLDRPPTVVPVV
jgi:hypothetical protein